VDSLPWFVRVGINVDYIRTQVMAELGTHFTVFVPLLLVAIAGWLWIGRDVDRLHKATERMSLVDPLTQSWNTRKLEIDLRRSLEHARRAGEALSFAMIDLDDFKAFNDRNGHQAGDHALQLVAGAIRYALRETDTCYRYGGEEFCVLLPAADTEGAVVVAERIRQTIAATRVESAGGRTDRMSASIGLASFPADADDSDGLIRRADAALYDAKSRGKDRVVVYHWSMQTPLHAVDQADEKITTPL
jgi:diguanylate cyclase (GGDEF)-like protein